MTNISNKILVLFIFLFFLSAAIPGLMAEEVKQAETKQVAENTVVTKAEQEDISITDHQLMLAGKMLKYRATAGCMIMKDEAGKQKASVFYIAYTASDSRNDPHRPITFAFNGGPGSSAVWLHLGALGPKRVPMADDTKPAYAVGKYIDNESTWLEFTDLVFIDPVSTGYSRPAQGVDKKEFHGVIEDIQSVGEFIRLYVTRNERWLSPKFIVGESYGTTRAGGLSGHLQATYGMYLKGIVLISSVLNFQSQDFAPGNDLPYAMYLPTYAATAWYHRKLPAELQQDLLAVLKEVEAWAQSEYTLALMKGDLLTGAERDKIIKKLSAYTGLPASVIDYYNLRIYLDDFRRELLRDEKRIVGRLDSRYTGCPDESDEMRGDAAYNSIYGGYAAALNYYVRRDLKYKNDLIYELISRNVHPWNWGSAIQGFVDTAGILRSAIAGNNDLKVLVASGYYDMATPYFSNIYTFSHLNLPEELRKNITFTYYEAGHMMYIHKPSLMKLKNDAHEFYRQAMK